jgi:hypothetical protein
MTAVVDARWPVEPEEVDGRDEALLHVSDLAGQGIGDISLTLPNEGCRADTSLTLRSCSMSSDEGSGESRVSTTGVEVGRRRCREGCCHAQSSPDSPGGGCRRRQFPWKGCA